MFKIQVPSALLCADQSHFLLCPKMGCEVAPKNVLFWEIFAV